MADDEDLARRVAELITDEYPELATEVRPRRMFGGLAFLVGGNMAVAAAGAGGLMVRCDPADTERHLRDGAEPMVMREREMSGWLLVPDAAGAEPTVLERWVRVGVGYAKSLPKK